MNHILRLQGLEVETPDAKLDLGAGACSCCGGAGHREQPAYRSHDRGHTLLRTDSDDYIYSSETA
ncbi:hypothetical protein JOF56_003799 [Kibdelosporangium banguiense]|uniref:Uncharacterized protein n=1 Tax=Kibdelosporangium banguiense TaxID=1365924 RepID=A0ABS4TG65_9PSEU|nr:hypothetical protein [Kibdelosporangium banguiense]